jgi:hypothetical protein
MRLSDTGGADVLFEKVFSRDIRISVVRAGVYVLRHVTCIVVILNITTSTYRCLRAPEAHEG